MSESALPPSQESVWPHTTKLVASTGPVHSERVLGSIIALGSGELLTRIVGFIGTLYLARRLGPEGFGIVAFAGALSVYIFLPVVSSLNSLGAREVARRPLEAPAIALGGSLLRLALGLFALAIIGGIACVLPKPATVKLVLVLTGLSFFSLALDTSWVLKGLERNRLAGFGQVVGQVLYVGAMLAVVQTPADVVWVPLTQFGGELGAAVLLAFFTFPRRRVKLRLREDWRSAKTAGFLILTRLLRTLLFTFDLLLLGFLLGERDVGLYAVPYRFCFLLVAVAAVIHISYLPAFTRACAGGRRELADLAGRSAQLSSAIGAPIVIGGIVLAAPLLETFFGPEYLEAATAFQLLLLSIGFYFTYGVIANILLATDRLKLETRIMAVAAALNLGLNVILIPRYRLVGAAAATVVSEGLIVTLGLLTVYRLGVRLDFRPALRPLALAGLMGAVLFLLGPDAPLALSVPGGAAIYVLGLMVSGSVPKDAAPQLQMLGTLVNKCLGKLKGRTVR